MPTIQWDAQVLAGSALLYWFQQGHRGRQGMQCLSPAQFPTWKLQNASTDRYPVICWILDLPFPWSFPTLLPHITYKKFRSQPLLQFSSVPGVIFNACQGVIEARMSLLPSNSAWRISITNSTQSSSLAVIQVIHLVQRVRQRLKKNAVIIVLLKHNGLILFLCGTKSASVIHTYCVGNMIPLKPGAEIWSIRLFKKSNKNLVLFKD